MKFDKIGKNKTDIIKGVRSFRMTCKLNNLPRSKIFKNIFNLIDPGSVVLLNDFLGKGDSMTILNAIIKEVEDNQEIVHLNKNYNVNEYTPNYTPNPEIQAFLRRCYSKTGIKPRNNTGYSYLIVQRKE